MDTWVPHKRETWPSRYGTLKKKTTMSFYMGHWDDGAPAMNEIECPSGTRVKIVMVSRFGDIGITNDLDVDHGYGARVLLEDLINLSNEPYSEA